MEFLLEKLLAPMVVGLLVLAGQFFIQPLIKRRVGAVEMVLKLKYEALENIVGVLEKFYATLDFAVRTEEGSIAIHHEVNHAYARLMLYAENPEILDAFKDVVNLISPFARATFYREVRKELGLSTATMTDAMEVPYFGPVANGDKQ